MLRTKWLINLLRIIWVLLLIKNEYLVFWSAAKNCSLFWSTFSNHNNNNHKFMIVSDPQMTDDNSYDRKGLIMEVTKFYSALYMKRNYRHLLNKAQPTDVFILGDLMDSGRDWESDEYFAKEVGRFNTIFKSPLYHSHVNKHYMVGNHDIGFGNGARLDLRQRFQRYFGNSSYVLNTDDGAYSFVVIDTVSLSSDDPIVRQEAMHVLESINGGATRPNRILMTHVPLYRNHTVSCGPHRQHPNTIIQDAKGYQYQNLVSRELSEYILNTVKPVLVFSGDDHDYCKITHDNRGAMTTTEITVPTFSMAQGVNYPGVVLLDLSHQNELKTELCWLPSQINLFVQYAYLLVFTVIVLLVYHGGKSLAILVNAGKKQRRGAAASKEEMGLSSSPYTPTTASLKRCLVSFFHSAKEVAIVAFLTYIICIFFI